MPTIDEKRILGNFGSNLVAHLLSNICLVRPVAEGTDIGIDLYCETIEEQQGFLHFWVQVKCGKQIALKKNGIALCKFETGHLYYWHRQPVPVFAFYVPAGYPPEIPKQIFVANITEHIMEHGIKEGKMQNIQSNFKITTGTFDWHNDFQQRLKDTTTLIKLREDGIFTNIPELRPKYTLQYKHINGSSGYAEKSLRTIRSTVSSLVIDAVLLKLHHSIEPAPEYFEERLVKILKIFKEGNRPEIMKALALWEAVIGKDPERAKILVENAFRAIDNDPNLSEPFRKSWKKEFDPVLEIIKSIEEAQQ